MVSSIHKTIIFWCILVISTSIILGHYTGPGGYIVPLFTGGMIINDLIRGRALPVVDQSKPLIVQFLVGFIALTSFVMLVSYVLGFIFLQ